MLVYGLPYYTSIEHYQTQIPIQMLQLYTLLHVIEAQLRQEGMHDPRQHLAGYVYVDAMQPYGGPASCNVYHLL